MGVTANVKHALLRPLRTLIRTLLADSYSLEARGLGLETNKTKLRASSFGEGLVLQRFRLGYVLHIGYGVQSTLKQAQIRASAM